MAKPVSAGLSTFCSTAGGPVQRVFREIFQEYGLPRAIVTDNAPFASTGVARLSRTGYGVKTPYLAATAGIVGE